MKKIKNFNFCLFDFCFSGIKHQPIHSVRNPDPFHEPSNEHAAPNGAWEGPGGVRSYRHGSPTELFQTGSWLQCGFLER